MDNLSANDIALGSLLTGGSGYRYGGAWGGGYPGSPFADFGSNAVRINATKQSVEDQADCTREVLSLQNSATRDSFENIQRSNQFASIKDGQFQSELRTNDRLRDLEMLMIQNAKDAAKCCCDAKLEAEKNKCEILSAIAAQTKETITRELDAANARITQLETINAIVNSGPGNSGN